MWVGCWGEVWGSGGGVLESHQPNLGVRRPSLRSSSWPARPCWRDPPQTPSSRTTPAAPLALLTAGGQSRTEYRFPSPRIGALPHFLRKTTRGRRLSQQTKQGRRPPARAPGCPAPARPMPMILMVLSAAYVSCSCSSIFFSVRDIHRLTQIPQCTPLLKSGLESRTPRRSISLGTEYHLDNLSLHVFHVHRALEDGA